MDIEAIEARLKSATAGTWEVGTDQIGRNVVVAVWSNVGLVCRIGPNIPACTPDATFIAHAPADIRFLLDTLTAERERAEEAQKDRRALLMEVDALRSSLQAEQERAGRMGRAMEQAERYILRAHARKLWNEHPSYDLHRAGEVAQENPPDIVLCLRVARAALAGEEGGK